MDARPTLTAESDTRHWAKLSCPECGTIAEVVLRAMLAGTSGGVEHVKIRCLDRHWFFMPVEMLDEEPQLAARPEESRHR